MSERPHRDIIEDLGNEGKVADAILLAWSIVEMNLDNAILFEYGVSSQNRKSEPLLDMRIGDKIKLQKALGHLSEQEVSAIMAFKKERNGLFHKGGVFFPNFQMKEKEGLMGLALKAADAAHKLLNRAISSRS